MEGDGGLKRPHNEAFNTDSDHANKRPRYDIPFTIPPPTTPLTIERVHQLDQEIDNKQYEDNTHKLEQEITQAEEEEVYCFCRKGQIEGETMVCCDLCNEWFHVGCVGLTQAMAKRMHGYSCPSCVPPEEEEAPPSIPKKTKKAAPPKKAPKKQPARKKPTKPATQKKTTKKSTAKAKPKVAAGPTCINCGKRVASGVMYCSNNCGVALAVERVRQQKLEEAKKHEEEAFVEYEKLHTKILQAINKEKESGMPISVEEEADLALLKEIAVDREDLKKRVEELEKLKDEVNEAMKRARKVTKTEAMPKRKPQTWELIDCLGCGQPFSVWKYASHSITCYTKIESDPVTGLEPTEAEDGSQIVHCDYYDQTRKTYCKKLKASCARHSGFTTYRKTKEKDVEVCGCPLSKGGYCDYPRKSCILHPDWENLRQANVFLLKITTDQSEKSLNYYHKNTIKRMISRRGMEEELDMQEQKDPSMNIEEQ